MAIRFGFQHLLETDKSNQWGRINVNGRGEKWEETVFKECREVVHLALALLFEDGKENKLENKQIHAVVKQGWGDLRLIIPMEAFLLTCSS